MTRRIIFLNRYFFPDHSATSQILSDLAFHLAARGESVHVIASRQLYGDAAALLPAHETIRNVEIHRIATTRFGRRALAGRAVDYASFYLAGAFALARLARRKDIVVAKTDPPMLSVLPFLLSRLRGFAAVNWLQDLYPEIAAELGVAAAKGVGGRLLAGIRNASLRGAAMNVAIGDDMARRVERLGVRTERLRVVANWADDEMITAAAIETNSLRRTWGIGDKFVVGYSGNLGRAHDIATLLDAADRLRDRDDIRFLFIGDGQRFSELKQEVERRGLRNFRFEPYQPRENLAQSLGVADVHWVSIKPELEGLVLPSKFYGIAAAGRPIMVVGSPEGELAKKIVRYDCGAAIAPGDGARFAEAVIALATDRARCRQMGANARHMLDEGLRKSHALQRWCEILDLTAAKAAAKAAAEG